MSKVRCFKGSAEILGERFLKFPGVGGRRWSLCVGTGKASVTAGKGFGVKADLGVECGFPGCLQGQKGCAGLGSPGREQVRLGGGALLPRQSF